jgi:hypothetical protein
LKRGRSLATALCLMAARRRCLVAPPQESVTI